MLLLPLNSCQMDTELHVSRPDQHRYQKEQMILKICHVWVTVW